MKIKISFLFYPAAIIVCSAEVNAQTVNIPRDTSYTLNSALEKAQMNNKETDLDITAVFSSSVQNIEITKDIIYKTLGDRRLAADLFYPQKIDGKTPAILIIHGGGWRQGNKSLMTPMAEKLAAVGYFVMAPEYRLSLESAYPGAVIDLYDAICWMNRNSDNFRIDMDRLIVIGCSAGGQLATLIGTTYNQPNNIYKQNKCGKIVAIVDVDGVLAFKHPDSEEGLMASQWLGGTYEEEPKIWNEASALNHVDQFTPPTLFLASIYPRFLAGREEYIARLQHYNTYSETHFIESAPHSFWLFNPWFETTIEYIKAFLRNNGL